MSLVQRYTGTPMGKKYAQFVQFFFYFIRTWTLMGSLFFLLSSQIASQILEGLALHVFQFPELHTAPYRQKSHLS